MVFSRADMAVCPGHSLSGDLLAYEDEVTVRPMICFAVSPTSRTPAHEDTLFAGLCYGLNRVQERIYKYDKRTTASFLSTQLENTQIWFAYFSKYISAFTMCNKFAQGL